MSSVDARGISAGGHRDSQDARRPGARAVSLLEKCRSNKAVLVSLLVIITALSATASDRSPVLFTMSSTSIVDEYINRSREVPTVVTVEPSNPWESRRIWFGEDEVGREEYLDMIDLVWGMYLEDLNYSTYLLDEYIAKNISGREAMTATVSLFVFTSQTVEMLAQIQPPSDLANYHNVTIQAVLNLEGYLWNMGRFYETNRRVYAMQAHDSFNKSMSFYDKGMEIRRAIA
ncbi:MAG: hypothetical protein N3G75_07560 [Methanothrix sp.]|nr:hypothetical protein [Methanothrix sp.]MCX8207675.1 hypothetical protein [Methanothrix sp.]